MNKKLPKLKKIHTNLNGVNVLTKGLPREKLDVCDFIVRTTLSFI